jgi:DNA-binding MarR family transcriptional regulator
LDEIVRFPARTKPLTKEEALEFLRREGRIESVSAFAQRIGWERTRASRAVDQWAQAGQVVRRPRPGGPTAVEAQIS